MGSLSLLWPILADGQKKAVFVSVVLGGIVKASSLMNCWGFTLGSFDLRRQVSEMYEAVFGVKDYTVVPH